MSAGLCLCAEGVNMLGFPVISAQVTLSHATFPAVAPAFRTLPLLVVPVAGTCILPSPLG